MRRFCRFASVGLLAAAACASSPTTVSIPSISATNLDGTPFDSNGAQTAAPQSPLGAFSGQAYHLGSFSGFMMDISQGNYNDGTPLIQSALTGGVNQLWHFVPAASTNQSYQFKNPASGKCADVAGQSIVDGAAVVLNTCSQVPSQQWTATRDANQNLVLHNSNSGLCLATANANPNIAGLVQTSCNGNGAQHWQVTPKTYVVNYGTIIYSADPTNALIAASMDMIVPPQPAATSTLFLAPNLQPVAQSASFQPIGLGVLEPVLTWGGSCALTPQPQPAQYSTWWISGQYLNGGSYPNHTGCLSGEVLTANVGDTLHIVFQLTGTVWLQTISNLSTGRSVTFSIDMLGQAQTQLVFNIIQYNVPPAGDTIFQNIQFTAARPDAGFCVPDIMGITDAASAGVVSSDSRTCQIAKVILRARGVAATTSNP